MAGRQNDGFLDELFSRVSIEEVVGRYVTLNKKGRYLWGCCPFHHEKTPSFKVDSENGMYYCFGCHKGGNIISFVKEYEHVEGRTAVEILAEMANLQVPEYKGNPIEDAKQKELKEQIFDANLFAARFFHAYIWKPEGAQALKYLYSRGLTDGDIRHFGLGCAPAHGSELYDALKNEGYSDEVIEKAWLGGQKDGRRYDMFRDRAIFPIINARGKVLGFGGRIMGKGEPKYLNTSDTPVFNKRNNMYGLNFFKDSPGIKRLVLVEGYMDTVALLKYGITGVVATLGTALTEEQVRLMKRYAHEVWISYDGDGAGRKAAMRALDMIEPEGLDVRVIDYPAGMDPDEFLKAYGTDAWENLPRHKAAKYRMLRAEDGLDLNTQEGLTEYTVRCCSILKPLTNAVEMENYLRELSAKTGYSREVLQRQIGVSQLPASEAPRERRERETVKKPISESANAQIQLIALMEAHMLPAGMVTAEDFDDSLYKEIFENLSEGIKPGEFLDKLPEEQAAQALEALNYSALPEDKQKALGVAEELLNTIRKSRINSRISYLTEKLKTTSGDERQELTRNINELLMKLM